ncbi:hypothetical protein [Arthrobacter psychrolactophilus]
MVLSKVTSSPVPRPMAKALVSGQQYESGKGKARAHKGHEMGSFPEYRPLQEGHDRDEERCEESRGAAADGLQAHGL